MRTLILLVHADPSVLPMYRAALASRRLLADIVPINAFAPGQLSGPYHDLARSVRRNGSILAGLLERFRTPYVRSSYDRIVLATFSAGFALAYGDAAAGYA